MADKKGTLEQNGVHVKDHEYETIKVLLNHGYDVSLIPPSQIENYRTPDILLQGVPWEMKSPIGTGKYTIKNLMQSASHQSENIIIDLRRRKVDEKLSLQEITRQFYLSKRIRKVKVILKSEIILDFSK